MDTLTFDGRARLAVKQLLDHTTLGERLVDDVADTGDLLTLAVPDEVVFTLSRGELVLWNVLQAFAGEPAADLLAVASDLDDRTAWVVWWALGVLLDKVVPMGPVDFDGLHDVVRRSS